MLEQGRGASVVSTNLASGGEGRKKGKRGQTGKQGDEMSYLVLAEKTVLRKPKDGNGDGGSLYFGEAGMSQVALLCLGEMEGGDRRSNLQVDY